MTGRRPRRDPPELPPAGVLDWSDRKHWARVQAPCKHCGAPTFLRNDDGLPADKVCTEQALAERSARTAAAYQNGQIG